MTTFHSLQIQKTDQLILETVIYCDETWPQVDRMVKRALRAGHIVIWPDGRQEWIEDNCFWDDDWHLIQKYDEFRQRYLVKWRRQRFVEFPDGTQEVTELSPSWRKA